MRSCTADQTIYFAGDPLECVGSIVSGVSSLTRTMPDGRVQMVGLLLPSDFMARPHRETIDSNVVAETDAKLCCFRRKPFETMANYLGLTIETVSCQMLSLKKEGVIVFDDRRGIHVPDLDDLKLETGEDA